MKSDLVALSAIGTGVFAFLTLLLSTIVVVISTGQSFPINIIVSTAMIIAAAEWGRRAPGLFFNMDHIQRSHSAFSQRVCS